ncbi:hypothetical protein [uncultured Winogradskyella sp.]|uniref:hypothetical protein n=1 Tax=uncultured Winogradskyella sp. TaxID=395353 RepID=UPI0026382F91|nr:hypothetical protein [uncultured Winogradskyella sp.]
MKKIKLVIFVATILLFQNCINWGIDGGEVIEGRMNYEPVVIQRSEFEASTFIENTPRSIENSGKIYVKGNFIFINEVNKGFHVINNTDPANPVNIGFIQVLGSSDLSIKNTVFYANNARDLIAFTLDESNESLTITKRIANVFPQIWTPDGPVYFGVGEDEIVVDWIPAD